MAKKITFTMSITYDEDETYAGNALHAVDHALFNIDGIYEWEHEISELIDVEYSDD